MKIYLEDLYYIDDWSDLSIRSMIWSEFKYARDIKEDIELYHKRCGDNGLEEDRLYKTISIEEARDIYFCS